MYLVVCRGPLRRCELAHYGTTITVADVSAPPPPPFFVIVSFISLALRVYNHLSPPCMNSTIPFTLRVMQGTQTKRHRQQSGGHLRMMKCTQPRHQPAFPRVQPPSPYSVHTRSVHRGQVCLPLCMCPFHSHVLIRFGHFRLFFQGSLLMKRQPGARAAQTAKLTGAQL